MGELTLFGAAANSAGFEAAIHMVRTVAPGGLMARVPTRMMPAHGSGPDMRRVADRALASQAPVGSP